MVIYGVGWGTCFYIQNVSSNPAFAKCTKKTTQQIQQGNWLRRSTKSFWFFLYDFFHLVFAWMTLYESFCCSMFCSQIIASFWETHQHFWLCNTTFNTKKNVPLFLWGVMRSTLTICLMWNRCITASHYILCKTHIKFLPSGKKKRIFFSFFVERFFLKTCSSTKSGAMYQKGEFVQTKFMGREHVNSTDRRGIWDHHQKPTPPLKFELSSVGAFYWKKQGISKVWRLNIYIYIYTYFYIYIYIYIYIMLKWF